MAPATGRPPARCAAAAASFRRYVEIVDENRPAVVLTYRESRTLDAAGHARLKELEVETAAPLRAALEEGIARGLALGSLVPGTHRRRYRTLLDPGTARARG